MLFWRAKTVKPAAQEAAVETPAAELAAEAMAEAITPAAPTASASDDKAEIAEAGDTAGKIVTLVPARLSERLAEVTSKSSRTDSITSVRTASHAVEAMTEASEATAVAGNDRTLSALRAVMSDTDAGSHVLVLGSAGSGRKSAALSIAREVAKARSRPQDWIYAATARRADALQAFPIPTGTGERLVRDVTDALSKSAAMLGLLMASDSHQMSLAVLDEEHRQRGEGGLEQLRRRAEAQNIALVKTVEGYVLAPMHDGRVVRADVFRALPEGLQRDVEGKVTALEAELQALLGALPGNDIAIDDRHLALSQQVAERAVKPNLAVARKLFATDPGMTDVFDAIEADWMRRASDIVRRGGNGAALACPCMQAISADADSGAPVVVARNVSARDLFGEIGHDMSGAIAVRPGHLARANGGFLIIDAWRLAAEPQGWAALSAALEAGQLKPLASPGVAVTAEAVPLHIKLILIAERRSLAKLKAIDPRTEQYFGSVVAFAPPAAPFTVREAAQ
jgi:hypothetical protein